MKEYDVIIIGAGHNGLVAACYLSKAGLETLVLEKRNVVGGACSTEEVFPGFKVSNAAYVCSLFHPKIIKDLKLEENGYEIYERDPPSFTPFPDGKYLFFWSDLEKTIKEIEKFSKKDAKAYREYETNLNKLSEFIEPLLLTTPPNPNSYNPKDLLSFLRLGLKVKSLKENMFDVVKIMTMSVKDFLDEWFESDELKSTLATDGIIGTAGGPLTPGTAYVLFHHVMGEVNGHRGKWGYVKGGMGNLSNILAKIAESYGAEIYTKSRVEKILIENNKVRGVVLDGEEIKSKIVVSNADPKITFLKLIDQKHLNNLFLKKIKGIKMDSATMKINLALNGLPDFLAYPGTNSGPQHMGTIHICPSMKYMEKAWDDAKYGVPSKLPILECCIPTVIDKSLAPEGKHIMSILVQYTPYSLNWDNLKESYFNNVIDVLSIYAPNIYDIIIDKQIISPLDLERDFSLTGGNIFHGVMSLDQLFFMRPVPNYSNYKTPIKNLYLCGSGTHPGGGVTGICGHNAAKTIIKDA